MIINTNSWHYKVWKWSYEMTDDLVPFETNLCAYVRCVFLLTPLKCLFFGFIFAVLYPIAALLRGLQIVVMYPFGYRPYGFDFDENRKVNQLTGPSKINLLAEWVAAKKQKVCPLVEFEDQQ